MRWQGLLGCVLVTAFLAGCADAVEPVDDCEGDACKAPACDHDHDLAANATDEPANATHEHECDDEPVLNATAPPIPVLTLATADGTPINGTSILEGESIVFSARGSAAEAGLQAAALTVTDANGTRTVTLYQDGVFEDATLDFPRAGIVNATLRALDEAGAASAVSAVAYVDRATSGSQDGKLYVPDSSGCSATVNADSQATLLGNNFYHKQTFQVGNGVQWISVEAANVQSVAICDPSGERIDEGDADGAAATAMGAWEPDTQYFVALHPSGPDETMSWTLTVHYGPKV